MTRRRSYISWYEMRRRCDNPSNPAYTYYGGRGISYDPHWAHFENFLEDMGERPKGLTLGRIDNDKDYSKENCRWETRAEQSQNQGIRRDNQTGIPGLFWSPTNNKWIARRRINGKTYDLYQGKSFDKAKSALTSFNQGEIK